MDWLLIANLMPSWLIVIPGIVSLLIWGHLLVRHPHQDGIINRYDATIMFIAISILVSFEILIMVSENRPLAVAASRVYRLWVNCAFAYIGYKQL
jgi:hypothetical protein